MVRRWENATAVGAMIDTLSIDPGRHAVGWAWWVDGVLLICGLATSPKTLGLGSAALHLADAIPAPTAPPASPVVYVERMQFSMSRKGRVKDLLDLAFIGGVVAASVGPSAVHPVTALQWKGAVPKDIQRKRDSARLTPDEMRVLQWGLESMPKGLQHNVWDAVGIGLYGLGRGK